MDKIEKLLSVGDLRMTGNVDQVIKLVLSEPTLFENVINIIISAEPATRMRASDTIEKITREHPEWLKPYKNIFLNEIANIEQKEVRWHLAQILPRFSLTNKEREKVYKLMIAYLKDESRIVKTFAMQALTDLAIKDNRYYDKVFSIIKNLEKNGVPSQQTRARKLLLTLEKRK